MKTQIEIYVINKVKELRIKSGMSQFVLADRLGLSSGFVGKVESKNSNSKYNLNHINQLSEIFGISPQFLLPVNFLKDDRQD